MHPQEILNVDAIYCLCLDKRKETWHKLITDLKEQGWENIIPFIVGDGQDEELEYDYIDFPPGDVFDAAGFTYGFDLESRCRHKNANYSQKLIFADALEKGYKRILFLEDDTFQLERSDAVLNLLRNKIEALRNFDLLYLSYYKWEYQDDLMKGENLKIEVDWREKQACEILKVEPPLGGLHAVVVNSHFFHTILRLPNNAPIDSSLNRIHGKIQSYLVTPQIFYVHSMYSNCEKRWTNRDKLE